MASDPNDWTTSGNALGGAQWIGSTNGYDFVMKVNSATAFTLDYVSTGTPNIVGGYQTNGVTSGVYGAFVGGGGAFGSANTVTDHYGVIGGGFYNLAGDAAGTVADHPYATVAGGAENHASGQYSAVGGGYGNVASWSSCTIGGGYSNAASASYATVGGGYLNSSSGAQSTVAGGYYNVASGNYGAVAGGYYNDATGGASAVGGGYDNTASGSYSAVPGGYQNAAVGNYSLAAGRRAKANQAGCFVLADSTNADLTCTVADSAWLRFVAGTNWYTNTAGTSGVFLTNGANSWQGISSRDAKEDIEAVDDEAVLEGLGGVDIYTWRGESEPETVRHMGPMAEDFHRAFGLGTSNKAIATIDLDGVALAAIRAVHAENQQLRREVESLREAIERADDGRGGEHDRRGSARTGATDLASLGFGAGLLAFALIVTIGGPRRRAR